MAGWVWSAAVAGFKDYPELHSPFKSQRFQRGLTQRQLFWVSHTNIKLQSHRQKLHLRSLTQWKEWALAARNHRKYNDEVFACCENVYPWKWGGENRDGVQHGQALIRTLLKYSELPKWCISPNHNLQPQNKSNSCPPPKCLMAGSYSLAGGVCNMAQVVAFDSANKRFRCCNVDPHFRITAWCHFWVFVHLLQCY